MSLDFLTHVGLNDANRAILSRWSLLDLPNSWLVAGCLFQTDWNIQAGRPPGADIKDYDIFYFDPSDLSPYAEAQVQSRIDALFGDLGVKVEVANQARVHLWYPEHFGQPYPMLASSEESVSRFLVLESCLAIRPDGCLSPHGFEGLYAGTLTPNPLTPYPKLFNQKAASYRKRWNWLRVRPPQASDQGSSEP